VFPWGRLQIRPLSSSRFIEKGGVGGVKAYFLRGGREYRDGQFTQVISDICVFLGDVENIDFTPPYPTLLGFYPYKH
jgi:hypothetical protein